MEENLITIVVPLYNGEKYITKCLDSIFNQTYKKLEILTIDDGSTDSSYIKAEEFIKNRSADVFNARLLRQENKGVACARNKGIEEASGEFIAFIDQDDYIDKNYIQVLLNNMQHQKSDIVVSGYCRIDTKGKKIRTVVLQEQEWAKFLNLAPWGKLYRLSYLKNSGIRFLDVKKGEDCYFNVLAYAYTAKVVTLPYVGYYWVDQQYSVTNRIHKQIHEDTDVCILFNCILRDLNKENYISDDLLEYYFIKAIVYDILFSAKQSGYISARNLTSELFLWLKNHFPEWSQNRNISFFLPKGERFFTKVAVAVFCKLYMYRLTNVFLRIYCRGSKT